MRIALYTETFLPKIDGIVKVACLTLDHFQRRGVEAVIVAPDQGVRDYAGYPVIGVPCVVNPLYPEGRLNFPHPGTYRAVKAFQPDIMHVFHPVMAGMAGMLFSRWLHVPSIASFHLDLERISSFYRLGFLKRPIRWATQRVFNLSSYVLAPSRLVQKDLLDQGVRKVGLWRRGVDAEEYHPRYRDDTLRARISDGHPDEIIMLYVGRLSAEKQIGQIRTVLEQVPGTRLALVGGGPYQAELETFFAGLPVKFVGYLTGQPLASAYASADIFVFPSAFESFGLVILEAMASGLPVVSSRVGGAQDMIIEGVNGFTFDVDDNAALVKAVRQIASDPAKRQTMSAESRRLAEAQSWSNMMDELLTCYEAVIAGQPPPI